MKTDWQGIGSIALMALMVSSGVWIVWPTLFAEKKYMQEIVLEGSAQREAMQMVMRHRHALAGEKARRAAWENMTVLTNLMRVCEFKGKFKVLKDGTPILSDVFKGVPKNHKPIPYYVVVDDRAVHGCALFPMGAFVDDRIVEFVKLANQVNGTGRFSYQGAYGLLLYAVTMPADDLRTRGLKGLERVCRFPVREVDRLMKPYQDLLAGKRTPKEAVDALGVDHGIAAGQYTSTTRFWWKKR